MNITTQLQEIIDSPADKIDDCVKSAQHAEGIEYLKRAQKYFIAAGSEKMAVREKIDTTKAEPNPDKEIE